MNILRRPREKFEDLQFGFFAGAETYKRFVVNASQINKTIYERIRYLHYNEIHHEQHFVCHTEKDKVVGVLGIRNSPEYDDVVWFTFISVDPKYRNMGIGNRLLEMCLAHVEAMGKRIQMSRYSDDGEVWLKPKIEQLEADRPHLFFDPNARFRI